MLQIKRKILAFPIQQNFFQNIKSNRRSEPKIIGYIHVLKPTRKLNKLQTVHLDLNQEETSLFNGLSETLQKMIVDANYRNWATVIIDNPSDEEILAFQYFYNEHAKGQYKRKLTKINIETLKLLRNKGAIRVAKLEDAEQNTLCYRIDVVSNELAMSLYECENYDVIYQSANEYLCWNSLIYLRNEGLKIYDFGDMEDLQSLEWRKEQFGGKVATVFSGYISRTLLSHFLLLINRLSSNKRGSVL